MLRAAKNLIFCMTIGLGLLFLGITAAWPQSSDPSLPFPVFKVGYNEPENAQGEQIGLATLIDHRGIFLSVGHVFWDDEDQEGNSDKFYIKYRGKKLWLHQLLFEEIKGLDSFPNDGVILLYGSLLKNPELIQRAKFEDFREPFPHYNGFSIYKPLSTGQYTPEIKTDDNGSESAFSGNLAVSLVSLSTKSEWCEKVYSIGVGSIQKGRSGSPVFDGEGNITGVVSAKGGDAQSARAIIIPSKCIITAVANSYYGKLRNQLASLWEDWRVDEIVRRNNYKDYFRYYLGKSNISIFDWLQLVSKYQSTDKNTNVMTAIDRLFPIISDDSDELKSALHVIIKKGYSLPLATAVMYNLRRCPITQIPLDNSNLQNDASSLRQSDNLKIIFNFSLIENCRSGIVHIFLLPRVEDISSHNLSGWVEFQKNFFVNRPKREEVRHLHEAKNYEELTGIEEKLLISVAASYNAASLANITFEKYVEEEVYRMGRMVDLLDWVVRLLQFYEDSSFPDNNSGIDKGVFCSFINEFSTQIKDEINHGKDLAIKYGNYMVENIKYGASLC